MKSYKEFMTEITIVNSDRIVKLLQSELKATLAEKRKALEWDVKPDRKTGFAGKLNPQRPFLAGKAAAYEEAIRLVGTVR
jgi:hypothetical protein